MKNNRYIKGFLEDIVLSLINDNHEMYGYEITKKVQEITSGAIKVTEGALYPVLHKLENSGQLSVDFRPAGGRLRKYYTLTPKGNLVASESKFELESFFDGMQVLLKLKKSIG